PAWSTRPHRACRRDQQHGRDRLDLPRGRPAPPPTSRVMSWSVEPIKVTDPVDVDLLRRYFSDVAPSFYGRPASEDEVTAALAEDPSDDLVPPDGMFFVARYQG